jgi:hypothetical protein
MVIIKSEAFYWIAVDAMMVYADGKYIVTVVPPPGLLSTVTWPPICRTNPWT